MVASLNMASLSHAACGLASGGLIIELKCVIVAGLAG
jgi:hypothetical protein